MLTRPDESSIGLPRVVCASDGCDVVLSCDPRHVDNLLAYGWTCSKCRRAGR